jgi:diguanylate cyclase (GGDEF)-like protein
MQSSDTSTCTSVQDQVELISQIVSDVFPDGEIITASGATQVGQRLSPSPDIVLANFADLVDGLSICQSVRKQAVPHTFTILIRQLIADRSATMADWKIDLLEAGADVCITSTDDYQLLRAYLQVVKRMAKAQEQLLADCRLFQFRATHDPLLTNLLNYSGIVGWLQNQLDFSLRHSTPVSLIMADIDNFRQVNNNYGHLAGNAVLHQVAERMLTSIRSEDAIGRFGGEEFLAVLSNCDAKQTIRLAERIRGRVSHPPIQTTEASVSINLSIGVTTILGEIGVEEAIKQADTALYRAKQLGKDRVCSYDKQPNLSRF